MWQQRLHARLLQHLGHGPVILHLSPGLHDMFREEHEVRWQPAENICKRFRLKPTQAGDQQLQANAFEIVSVELHSGQVDLGQSFYL
eukprot:CAMPEP_0115519070 /NCGR_PEP_ID=MMETSP0271-20121206/78234_1 /TAXON_ID=71861 /ORGANISM="Scrippsiella trochoidea, Strain CCMP3099" /LENGTH=86 /DNA_ID=CAMNT_0002950045 /DNA_START=377 /DNA_END=637 /DNA_ORIENTATION=-